MVHQEQRLKEQEERATPYFENLARVSATLLAALLALFTFLLVVGVQNSIKGFSGPLNTAIIILGASLILHTLGYMIREFYYATQKRKALAAKLLKVMRLLQQLVFIASIGAVVWFAITFAQLLLNPKPVQQQQVPTSSQQGAPASNEPAGGHASGE